MASTEILKLLAAGSVNLSGSAGGNDPLSAADVAGMLAGLSREATLVGYAKYVQDDKALIQLASHVYNWSVGVALKDNWRIVKGQPIVRNMSHLAVAEFCFPDSCLLCGGVGFVGVKCCNKCNGSGYGAIRDADRAREIGIDKSRFSRCWGARYEQIYDYLMGLESQLSCALRMAGRSHEHVLLAG